MTIQKFDVYLKYKIMKELKFNNWKCSIKKNYYNNRRPAIVLVNNLDEHDVIAVATINLPDVEMDDNEVAIKNYSENRGILEALVNADIIETPHRYVKSGYVDIPICRLKV